MLPIILRKKESDFQIIEEHFDRVPYLEDNIIT